jgi:hypothetical protein
LIGYDPHRLYGAIIMRGRRRKNQLYVTNEEVYRLAQGEGVPVRPQRVLIFKGEERLMFAVRMGGEMVGLARGQKDTIVIMPKDCIWVGWKHEDQVYALLAGPAYYFDMLASVLLATKGAFYDPVT